MASTTLSAGYFLSPGPEAGVRLTRRGRLLRSALLGAVLVTGSLAVVEGVAGRGESVAAQPVGASSAGHVIEVVVAQGDSLWSISRRLAPGRDPRGVVDLLREQNGLPSNLIRPGQVLHLDLSR